MSVLKNIGILFGGSASSQLIVLLMMPLLTRHYEAAAFGEWALFIAIAATLIVVSALKLEASILLPYRKSDAIKLFKAAIITTTATSVLMALIIAVFSFAGLINQPAFTLLPFMVLLGGCTQASVVWSNRNENYTKIIRARVVQSAATAAFNLFFIYLIPVEGGAIDLILASMIGQYFGLVAIVDKSGFKNIQKLIKFWHSIKISKQLLYKYRDFPLYSTPEALLATFSSMLPLYSVNHFFSLEDSGQVALTWRFLMFPAALIGGAVSTVIAHRFVIKLGKNEPIAKDILSVWFIALLAGLLPALAIIFFGSDIFALLFGDKWINAGYIASNIVIFAYLIFSFSLTSGAHVALRMQHLSLIFAVVLLILKILSATIYYNNLIGMLMSFLVIDFIGVFSMNIMALLKAIKVNENINIA